MAKPRFSATDVVAPTTPEPLSKTAVFFREIDPWGRPKKNFGMWELLKKTGKLPYGVRVYRFCKVYEGRGVEDWDPPAIEVTGQ